jgi:hypothetical protein
MRYSSLLPVLAAGLTAAAPVEQRDVAMDFNPPPGVKESGYADVEGMRGTMISLLKLRREGRQGASSSLYTVTRSLASSMHEHLSILRL